MPITISKTLQEIIREVAEQDKKQESITGNPATLAENMKIIEMKQNARVEFYLRAMVERLSVCTA
jgi:hypothetical protein